ncbi:MAG: hypothetical protein R3B91_01935 [Planctomycetaceae bacterium]
MKDQMVWVFAAILLAGCDQNGSPASSPQSTDVNSFQALSPEREASVFFKEAGGQFSNHYKSLRLNDLPLTDEELRALEKLPELEILDLSGTQISDSGVASISGLVFLRTLSLSNTAISDQSLKHLLPLADLRELYLMGTQITDDGLKLLTHLENLQVLDLSGDEISDQGLKGLTVLPKIRELGLANTMITDAGIERLTSFPNLQGLSLSGAHISDSGVETLKHMCTIELGALGQHSRKGLYKLKRVDLSETQITDASLEHMKMLQGLERLDVSETKLTAKSVAELVKAST